MPAMKPRFICGKQVDWVTAWQWMLGLFFVFSCGCWWNPTNRLWWLIFGSAIEVDIHKEIDAPNPSTTLATDTAAGKPPMTCWWNPGCLNLVTDRDLLGMMLVFIANTLVFLFTVAFRATGHRCCREKKADTEDDANAESSGYEGFDLDEFDNTKPLPRPAPPLPEENGVLRGLGDRAKSAVGLGKKRPGPNDLQASIFDGDGLESDNVGEAEEDEENIFDTLEGASMELLSLLNIVRQPDELVFVHCGADAYVYMRFQKFMINLLWAMSAYSMLVLLTYQYHNRLQESDVTFYFWANAGNLPDPTELRGVRKLPDLGTGEETGCGKNNTGDCLTCHFYGVLLFTIMVLYYLKEFRKLMVKLTDPTYVHELESRLALNEGHWGGQWLGGALAGGALSVVPTHLQGAGH